MQFTSAVMTGFCDLVTFASTFRGEVINLCNQQVILHESITFQETEHPDYVLIDVVDFTHCNSRAELLKNFT